MPYKKSASFFIFLLLTLIVYSFVAKPAQANMFDDLVNGVKGFFSNNEKPDNKDKNITIDSSMSLALDGDVNKNGEIDSGDTVHFAFQLYNPTDETLKFTNLKTNIDRKLINYIRNEYGITGFNDDGKTLEIANIILYPNQTVEISFDADVSYFSKEDKVLSIEAELHDKDQKSIAKALKKEISAKKLDKESMEKFSNLKEVKQP